MFHDRTWPTSLTAVQRSRQARTDALVPSIVASPTPNWNDLFLAGDNTWQQITGISGRITLGALTSSLGTNVITVYVNSSASTTGATTVGTLTNNATIDLQFEVQAGQYVGFYWTTEAVGTFANIVVRNVTNGYQTLDTILISNA